MTLAPGRRTLGRDFWLYFSGQLTSQVGNSFTLFALPLLVFKLTHSATNLALTTASNFVPYLLFGLVLGALVDLVRAHAAGPGACAVGREILPSSTSATRRAVGRLRQGGKARR